MKKATIEFNVEGFPLPLILSPKHHRYPLARKLQKTAKSVMQGKLLLKGDLTLEVEQEIGRGDRRTDVANLIGGIANTLEGIIYINDNQIKEVHYKQTPSDRDAYKVKIREQR